MWNAGSLDHLLALLAAEFALAVASDVIGRIVGLVDSLLSELYSNATIVRLMEHAATLDLEDFDDAELQAHLNRAPPQVSGHRPPSFPLLRQSLYTCPTPNSTPP